MNCSKCGYELKPDWVRCPVCGARTVKHQSTKKRGNGQGTVYKRGSTWTAVRTGYSFVDDTGRLIRKRPSKGGFRTKKQALLWACTEEDKITVPKLIELWQGYSKNDMLKLSQDKQTAYKIARNRLEGIMNRRVDTLTVEELQAVINEKCTSYYTAKDVRDLLSNLYKRAMASNHSPVNQNLARHLVLPPLEEKEAVPFTEAEVNAVWKLYNGGDVIAGFTLLMIYSGMMPGELMQLKKDMIDVEALEIRGAGKKTKVRKKAVIVFPDFMKPVIESLMNYAPDSEKLYPVSKDNFYKFYYASLERAQVRKLPPYSCRHTFGTEIVKAGLHPAMIQRLLRHANQSTQQKYTHLSAADEHDAMVDIWSTN